MRATRIVISAVMLGTVALPLLSTTTDAAATVPTAATAAGSGCYSLPPLPYTIHTAAVTIRSKATAKSTALGVLYRSHKFTAHKKSGNWLYITDRTTGVKGWVSGTYVYRDTRMCLD